jgi:hypothetical protein
MSVSDIIAGTENVGRFESSVDTFHPDNTTAGELAAYREWWAEEEARMSWQIERDIQDSPSVAAQYAPADQDEFLPF